MREIYICTDTITGLCSALHDAWLENRNGDAGIGLRGRIQQQLFCQYKTVEETDEKAQRLQRMVKRYLGYNAYWDIYYALLSEDQEKGTEVFRVMQEARNIPDSRKIMDHLGNPDVAKVFAMSRSVSNEAHMYEEFIRFRELKNGILFSEITSQTGFLLKTGQYMTRLMKFFLSIRKMRDGDLSGVKHLIRMPFLRCLTGKKIMLLCGKIFLMLFRSGSVRIQNVNEIICRFVFAGT